MFDFVRKHTRILQVVLFLLIFPSFIVVGVSGYNQMSERGEAVAQVDGRDIRKEEWDAAHRNEIDRLRQRMPNLDAKLLDSPQARYGTLERMVQGRVFDAAAAQQHLTASDLRVAAEIQSNPVVASLRGPDGRLDMARYRQFLSTQGMTPEMFEAQVRAELSSRQVLGGISASGLVAPSIAGNSLGAYFERREVQVASFRAQDLSARVSVTDADVEAFYKANPQLFQAPEAASVEYVQLDLDAVRKSIAVNEGDLKTYYDQNIARFTGKEERRASHILITVPKSAPPADKEKAKARATELLAQVRKNPAAFADLARKNSQDPGSAAQGGDLDYFARGAMVKPFEDAVFAMKAGEIGELVESEFGYHIVRLTDVRQPKQKSFQEMRPEIEAELRKQQAQKKYAEAAESFSNGVYEQSDTLKPVAEKLKLEIHAATQVARQPAQGASGPLANPKFLAALFSSDAIEKKRNTEALEIGPSQMVSGRITQYTPARTRDLAEVRDDARARLIAQKAADLARKEGQDKLAAWKAAPGSASLGAAVVVSREDLAKQPPQVVDAALRADPSALPALVGVDLGRDGYAVVRVNKVVPRTAPPAEQARQEVARYAQSWADAESAAYYELIKERYQARVLTAKPAADAKPAQ